MRKNIKIYRIKEDFDLYKPEEFLDQIQIKIKESKDYILLLIPATHTGNDLASRASVLFGCSTICDCSDVYYDEELEDYVFVRPDYNSEQYIHYVCKNSSMTIITLKDFPEELEESADIISLKNSKEFSRNRVCESRKKQDIKEAKCLVAGGNGIREKKDFQLLEKMAELLQGQLCVSRPIVDKGWFEKDIQVGLSGQTVKPDLYIAIAVSGAFQHMVGMRESKITIAINMDRNASIFDEADFGIVANYKEVLAALME